MGAYSTICSRNDYSNSHGELLPEGLSCTAHRSTRIQSILREAIPLESGDNPKSPIRTTVNKSFQSTKTPSATNRRYFDILCVAITEGDDFDDRSGRLDRLMNMLME